eukprot:358710_1
MSRVVSVSMLLALVLSVNSRHSRMLLGNSHSGSGDGSSCDLDKYTCGGFKSCFEDTVDITVCSDGFAAECTGKRSCQGAEITIDSDGYDIEYVKCDGELSCKDATFTIDCGGEKFKGVSCNGEESCKAATFIITNCILEKFECNNVKACYNADITFDGGDVQDFVCNSGSNVCGGTLFSCVGSSECP